MDININKDESIDDLDLKGLKLIQKKKAFRFGIDAVLLSDFANVKSKNLPYGAQRRLEIARALATNPKLLLLDEPAAGMNPTETEELMKTIRFIRDKFDIAVLLIEHDMKLVMGVCEKITVLNFGQVLMSGTPQEVQNDPEVIKAYIGD